MPRNEICGADLAEIRRTEEYGNLQEEAETEILDGIHPEISALYTFCSSHLCLNIIA